MLARLESAAVLGVDAYPVHVEVDVGLGLPFFRMVGLPDASVRESRDRVRAAIRNSGFDFPSHRMTINLAPADVRKAGSSFDLPIALGILAAEGVVRGQALDRIVLVGELSLDGSIHAARGMLPVAAAARRQGATALLLPAQNVTEAAVVEGLRLLPVQLAARGGRGAESTGIGVAADPGAAALRRPRRSRATASTCVTCAANRLRGGPSRSRPRAGTIF